MTADPSPKKYHNYWRFDPSARTNEIGLTPGRLDRLEAFFRHGLLSTEMLHALVEPSKSQKYTTEELKRMKRVPNKYLEQPRAQEDTMDARINRLIYRISEKGVEALIAAGRITYGDARLWQKLRSQHKENQFWHDAGTSYVTASMEIGTRELGLRYLSVFDIFRAAPPMTRDAATPLAIPFEKSLIIPDAIFGVQEGEAMPTYFALETDMGTEQAAPNQLKTSTLTRKYLGYRNMFLRDLHLSLFGIPAIKLLFVTTKHLRLDNMKQMFKRLADEDTRASGVGPTYFRCIPELDRRVRAKPAPNGDMLTTVWQRIGAPDTFLHKKRAA